ncbi:hypothetical protein NNA36_12690 [Shimia sp. CNT1-13L.2]|uniref:hypothetical protein n=1 Tax=Shimia sp. CNT1-13L.2 TaxID=2959663 RepID=UPI0020CDF20D|nr:hypothetical protein [Shimia sp. CNT1-13L.2]MCP9482821.1 hypothetical protein [Shimia sp. CNT1-13L.2]
MSTPETVSYEELRGRVEPFLIERLNPQATAFDLRRFIPEPTWNRFDLGFKLLYLDALEHGGSAYADEVYQAHIAAFSLGDMVEPGNEGKLGIDRFRADFQKLNTEIAIKGFDASVSLVPLAEDGSILNAAHRVACAIRAGKEIAAVETGLDPMVFDYRFFAKRGMDEGDLDACAVRMVEAMPNAAVALLWPAAQGQDKAVDQLIGPLVYRRRVDLTMAGGQNLLARVYQGEPWLGEAEAHFPGVRRKLMACFSGRDPLRVLVFDAPPERDRVALKDDIRGIYGIGKSSIHITDTHAEAVELARLLFNANARHFLDHAKPTAFAETGANMQVVQDYLRDVGGAAGEVALDTGMVMAVYGLRAPGDIDVVTALDAVGAPFETHDAAYHDVGTQDLLYDPKHHFYFRGLKFLSLDAVRDLKKRRLAGRDREDLLLIEPLLKEQSGKRGGLSLSLRLRMALLKVRRRAIKILFRLGVGETLRRWYRAVLRK